MASYYDIERKVLQEKEKEKKKSKENKSSYYDIERKVLSNQKLQTTSADVDDWFNSSRSALNSAQSRLGSTGNYSKWKEDNGTTYNTISNNLNRASNIKSYLEINRNSLGKQRYTELMNQYNTYVSALKETSESLNRENSYYSNMNNSDVLGQMTSGDLKAELSNLEKEQEEKGGKLKNTLLSWGQKIVGDEEEYLAYKREAARAEKRKAAIANLKNETFNREVSEQIAQLDETTKAELMKVPEYEYNKKRMNIAQNHAMVKNYDDKISTVKEEIRKKGFNPDDLIHYAELQYNAEASENIKNEWKKAGEESPFLSSAFSVPVNLASGLGYADVLAQNVRNAVSDDYRPVDYNRLSSSFGNVSDSIREGVMDEYDWNVGNYDVFDTVYGAGMSVLDSVAATAVGGVAGKALGALGTSAKVAGTASKFASSALLGSSAANSTMHDVAERGGTESQALAAGTAAGIFESLFESGSIGNFSKLKEVVDPKSLKDVAFNLLKSAGVNASEEAATELANVVYDTIANGDVSNYKLMLASYMKQGMSESDAKKRVAADLGLQVFESGVIGGLTGIGMGSVGTTMGYLNNRANGTAITSKTVAGFDGGNQTDITQRLEELGIGTQEAVKLSPVIQKRMNGEKLTKAERKLLGGSQAAQNVVAELTKKKDTTADVDMETVKQEYQKAVNPKIVDFVNRVRNFKNKDAASKVNIELAAVTEREAQDIKKLTNIDVSEFKRSMDGNTVEHIDKRHGENGAADSSMSDINDIARIEYVLENYDNLEKGQITTGKDSTLNNRYRDSNNKLSQVVVYEKRVNGNYYVVEAVPDSNAKTLRIVSAYKTKAEGVSQVLNMPESPQPTSETPHAFAPSNTNVSQSKSYVNAVPATVDGQAITVNGIDHIETNGNQTQLYVKTENGESVALSDVEFADRETQSIYNIAQGFDNVNTARAFISGYKQGNSAKAYFDAFFEFRKAGMSGQSFDSVLQSTANKYGNLEVSQLRQAYYAGVNEENTRPKQYTQKQEERAEKKGGLLRNYKQKLTREQAGQVYLLEALAKKFGFVVEVRDTLAEGMANGEYDPKTDRIYIALDAENSGYLRVAGHELYHYIEEKAPEAAEKLREFVIGRLKAKPDYDYEGRVKELQKLYADYGQEDIDSEITAECMFDVFDEQSIRELVKEDHTLAKKIQSWIEGFIESINEALKNLGLKSPEIRALEDDLEALETIREQFTAALEDIKEKKASGEIVKTDSKETVKHSIKNKQSWYDYSVSFAQQIDDYKAGKLPQYDTLVVGPTPEVLQKIGFNALPMTYATGHLKDVLAGIKEDHDFGEDNLKKLPKEIKNPVAVIASDSHPNTSVVAILEMSHQGKQLMTAVEIDGFGRQNDAQIDSNAVTTVHKRGNAITGLLNNAIKTEEDGNVGVFYIDKKRASGLLERAGLQLPSALFRTDGYIHSIRNSDSPVNPKFRNVTETKQFKRWFGDWQKKPNTASKVVNADGTPKIMYHGTSKENGDFYVFDESKAKKKGGLGFKALGKGNYFTSKELDGTERYGSRVISAYLNIKNPFYFYGGESFKEAVCSALKIEQDKITYDELQQEMKKRGYDGVIQYDKNNEIQIAVAFESEQIKSATDNIGLFDGKNPNVKYSLKNTAKLEAENKKLIETNEKQRQYISELECEIGLKGKTLDERAIRRLAGSIVREYSSVYDKATLTQNLTNIFEYIANGEDVSYEEVMSRTAELAKAVIEDSDVINDQLWQEYSGLREHLRTTSISLSEQQKNEVAYYYGSYEAFRRQTFGKIRFSEGGMPLEDLWGELSAEYPELFKSDTHELEQALVLADTYNELRPYHENPFGMNIDAESYDLAMRIYEEYYNIPELKSLRQRIEQEYREKYEKREAEIKAKEAEKRHALSEQIAKQKAMYEQRTFADRNERLRKEAIAKHRRSIERNVKTLNRWLQNPDKTRHVPEALRSALGEFLTSLDVFGTSRSNEALEWRQSMMELKHTFDNVQKDDTESQQFLASLDPDLLPMMTTIMELYKGSSVRDLDVQALAELDTIVEQIRGGIKRANNLLVNSRFETVHELANASINEMDNLKEYDKIFEKVDKRFNLDMLDSRSFFHQLGPASETLWESIREGFDERVEMISEANQFMTSIVTQKQIAEWESEKHSFEVTGGEVTLSVSQIMELYNLSKREQAQTHLLVGGIRPQDTALEGPVKKVKGKFDKSKKNYAKAIQVTVEDIADILNVLTPEQQKVAEKMQRFLSSDVAEWGNKTSMTLYGYKKFKETNYWPIQVNKNSVRNSKPEDEKKQTQRGFYDLINIGATKTVQKDASNGLFIKGAFDTFTKHVTEMSAYSAFAVPITDAMKWYDAIYFDEKADGHIELSSTKQSIERAFGKGGKEYFEQFIRDLNGSTEATAGGIGEETLIRNFKVASVGANLRVAVQQPTAYLRAASEMDMKYLAKGLLSAPASKEAIEKSAIAKWKSWGFYETNMGITMKQLITGQQTKLDWIRDKSMWLAGKGDEITWGALWNACKAEISDKTDFVEGTDEFDVAVADRFSEIVDKTQVVDSLLHRSQLLRDGKSFTKMVMAFKSEPTKSYNMLRNAYMDFHNNKTEENKKKLARVAITHIATSVLTAGAAAVVDSFRKDDDEKEWLELYLSAFGGNIADNVNPLSAVPYVGDVLSLLNGYSVERMDMAGIEALINAGTAWMKFFEEFNESDSKMDFLFKNLNGKVWKLMFNSAKGISQVTGIPIANAMRTVESIYNKFSKDNLGEESNKQEYSKLVKAIRDGKGYQKAYNNLIKKGYTQGKIENGIRDVLVKSEPRIAEAAQARARGNMSEYEDILHELVGEGYPQNSVIGAINNYMTTQSNAAQFKANEDEESFESQMEKLLESGYDEDEVEKMVDELADDMEPEEESDEVKDKMLYEYKDLKNVVRLGDSEEALRIVDYLKENGKEDKDIKKALTEEFKPKYQEMYRRKDETGMKQLRKTLFNLGLGYDMEEDFQKWIKDMSK